MALNGRCILLLLLTYFGQNAAQVCNLTQSVIDEINSYQDEVDQIIDIFTQGALKSVAYDRVAFLTDTFGHRLAGSNVLEDTIDFVLQQAATDGFDNVYTEDVAIENWVRNDESLLMLSPRQQELKFLALGGSIGTPEGGIQANVLVVTSFDDLQQNADQAIGKIVVYDVPFTTYGETATYRVNGAVEAARVGAVASLVRSITPFSIGSPHTGIQSYDQAVAQIPTGAITVEDSAMFHRMQDRGEVITLQLTMASETLNTTTSRNAIFELNGYDPGSEFVIVSGHIDSWDVGTGVMDDAGGCIVSWMAGVALRTLNLIPRRTLRTIMFTAEEFGVVGGAAYYQAHVGESENFQLITELDSGIFTPSGIRFSGTDEARCIMQQIVSLMGALNSTELSDSPSVPDLTSFLNDGVPSATVTVDRETYFWFHHSEGDRMEVVDVDTLDQCAALLTAVAYITADMSFRLPSIITKVIS